MEFTAPASFEKNNKNLLRVIHEFLTHCDIYCNWYSFVEEVFEIVKFENITSKSVSQILSDYLVSANYKVTFLDGDTFYSVIGSKRKSAIYNPDFIIEQFVGIKRSFYHVRRLNEVEIVKFQKMSFNLEPRNSDVFEQARRLYFGIKKLESYVKSIQNELNNLKSFNSKNQNFKDYELEKNLKSHLQNSITMRDSMKTSFLRLIEKISSK